MVEHGGLPRAQAGGRPQHLLITILGDYWFDRAEHLPSAALVDLLAEFDVSEAGARAALSRLAKRGLLESSKRGRHTAYGLNAKTSDLLARGLHRILSFGAEESTWDGRWTVAAFSVPEDQRDLRHALRSRLRWLGLASLYDGVWVSPRPVAEEVAAVLDELRIATATVFVAEHIPHGGQRGFARPTTSAGSPTGDVGDASALRSTGNLSRGGRTGRPARTDADGGGHAPVLGGDRGLGPGADAGGDPALRRGADVGGDRGLGPGADAGGDPALRPATDVGGEAGGDRASRWGGDAGRDAAVPGGDDAGGFLGDPAHAWDLDGLHEIYVDLLDRHRPLLDRARSGRVGSAEALVARTALMDAWRTLPNVDPELPRELLRTPFPRAEARALFVELYDCLAPLAEARVRQVVGAHDPELSRLVHAHDSRLPRR
jgi:DNA-binding transcriptional regulator PaaX